jgi:anti-anti-sigma factor
VLTEWSADDPSAEELAALELAVTVHDGQDGPVIDVRGGLVSSDAERLTAVVEELLDEGAVLTIDLTQLALLDSAGVAVLLGAVHRAEERSVDLRMQASPPAADLLERTGVAAGAAGRATIVIT